MRAFRWEQTIEKISFAVPTGNFGNVYAAYCAKKMGAPIDKLIIGSNRNDILTRFFETGKMTKEMVEPSLSPSMDIQVSSNFERFLFDLLDRDGSLVRSKMEDFKIKGQYDLGENQTNEARKMFESYRCSDENTIAMMSQCYKDTRYILDPHTSVGVHAAKLSQYKKSPVVALSCAHPAKFPDAVKAAIGLHPSLPPHLSDLHDREERMDVLENDIEGLKKFILERISL